MTLTLERYEDSSVHWWLEELEKAIDENKQRESEGAEASGLDEEQADNDARLAFGYGPDKDHRNGRGWGRRKTDLLGPAQVSFLNRVQESGEVQGRILGSGSSSYTFEHGALTRDKDESS